VLRVPADFLLDGLLNEGVPLAICFAVVEVFR
jgi:hypothetical protein